MVTFYAKGFLNIFDLNSIVFTKDDESAEYTLGDSITVPGKCTLVLTDDLSNKTEMSFEIVQPLVKKFTYNFDNTPGFEKAFALSIIFKGAIAHRLIQDNFDHRNQRNI